MLLLDPCRSRSSSRWHGKASLRNAGEWCGWACQAGGRSLRRAGAGGRKPPTVNCSICSLVSRCQLRRHSCTRLYLSTLEPSEVAVVLSVAEGTDEWEMLEKARHEIEKDLRRTFPKHKTLSTDVQQVRSRTARSWIRALHRSGFVSAAGETAQHTDQLREAQPTSRLRAVDELHCGATASVHGGGRSVLDACTLAARSPFHPTVCFQIIGNLETMHD